MPAMTLSREQALKVLDRELKARTEYYLGLTTSPARKIVRLEGQHQDRPCRDQEA